MVRLTLTLTLTLTLNLTLTRARVLLARAAVRTERRAQAEADLELAQLERQASIIQGAWAHKKAGQRTAAEMEQRAVVLVQSWAR